MFIGGDILYKFFFFLHGLTSKTLYFFSLLSLWSRPSRPKKNTHRMRILLPFFIVQMKWLFSRFSYDCKRPYMIWTVFRTRPNNVVRTQIVFQVIFFPFDEKKIYSHINPFWLLSVLVFLLHSSHILIHF